MNLARLVWSRVSSFGLQPSPRLACARRSVSRLWVPQHPSGSTITPGELDAPQIVRGRTHLASSRRGRTGSRTGCLDRFGGLVWSLSRRFLPDSRRGRGRRSGRLHRDLERGGPLRPVALERDHVHRDDRTAALDRPRPPTSARDPGRGARRGQGPSFGRSIAGARRYRGRGRACGKGTRKAPTGRIESAAPLHLRWSVARSALEGHVAPPRDGQDPPAPRPDPRA